MFLYNSFSKCPLLVVRKARVHMTMFLRRAPALVPRPPVAPTARQDPQHPGRQQELPSDGGIGRRQVLHVRTARLRMDGRHNSQDHQ